MPNWKSLDERIAAAERERRWHDLDVLNAQKLTGAIQRRDADALAAARRSMGGVLPPTA